MNVAVLGTGLMGRAMAERLAACGHQVVVYNRTPAKSAPLARLGIEVAATTQGALQQAACALLVLSDAAAIRSMLSGAEVAAVLGGKAVIQMGTIGPAESRGLLRDLSAAGCRYLEAPVLGSSAEVQAGRLIVMVGSRADEYEQWAPLLSCLGSDPEFIGPVGSAAALKLALNQLIASHIVAFSLSLGYVARTGVSVELFRKVLGRSALSAPMFEKKYPRLERRRYENPNFSVRHLLKDVRLFLGEAEAAGLDGRSLGGVPSLLERAIELHHGDDDYSAVFEAINPNPSPDSSPEPPPDPSGRRS